MSEDGSDEIIMKTRILLDYYKNATTRGKIDNPDIVSRDENISCGDEVEVYIKLNGEDKILDAKFTGHGCIISQASAAIMTEMIIGRKIEDVAKMDKKELLDTLGIPLGPVRIKCALLSYKVVKKGALEYISKKTKG